MKLPIHTSVEAAIDLVEVRLKNPTLAGFAIVGAWVCQALDALERIAAALERIAEAQAPVAAPIPLVVAK